MAKEKAEWVRAADLVMDMALYPRPGGINPNTVASIAQARASGQVMKPVLADRATRKLADGWHRTTEVRRTDGPDAMIQVIWRDYESDRDLFRDACAMNAGHGTRLSIFDKNFCLGKGEELGMPIEEMAGILHMTVEKARELRVSRTAIDAAGLTVPLKRPFGAQFAGRRLTVEQAMTNRRSSGMMPAYHANQLIRMIENDMLPVEDNLMATLSRLAELLETCLAGRNSG